MGPACNADHICIEIDLTMEDPANTWWSSKTSRQISRRYSGWLFTPQRTAKTRLHQARSLIRLFCSWKLGGVGAAVVFQIKFTVGNELAVVALRWVKTGMRVKRNLAPSSLLPQTIFDVVAGGTSVADAIKIQKCFADIVLRVAFSGFQKGRVVESCYLAVDATQPCCHQCSTKRGGGESVDFVPAQLLRDEIVNSAAAQMWGRFR